MPFEFLSATFTATCTLPVLNTSCVGSTECSIPKNLKIYSTQIQIHLDCDTPTRNGKTKLRSNWQRAFWLDGYCWCLQSNIAYYLSGMLVTTFYDICASHCDQELFLTEKTTTLLSRHWPILHLADNLLVYVSSYIFLSIYALNSLVTVFVMFWVFFEFSHGPYTARRL